MIYYWGTDVVGSNLSRTKGEKDSIVEMNKCVHVVVYTVEFVATIFEAILHHLYVYTML